MSPAALSSGTSNQKVAPRPGSESTPMLPPIRSTMRLQITSPRPVPPYRRVVEASACANARNRLPMLSLLMPMPVSRTSKRNSCWVLVSPLRVTTTVTAAALGELERVADQVGQHLAQAHRIAAHGQSHGRVELQGQAQAFGLGRFFHQLHDRVEQVAQVEAGRLQLAACWLRAWSSRGCRRRCAASAWRKCRPCAGIRAGPAAAWRSSAGRASG